MVNGEWVDTQCNSTLKVKWLVFGQMFYVKKKKDKLAFILYKVLFQLDSCGEYHSQWLDTIRTTLRNVGIDEFWDNQFNMLK